MKPDIDTKVGLLRVISLIVGVYSTIPAILTYFSILPDVGIHNIVRLFYGLSSFAIYFGIKHNPENFHKYLIFILTTSLLEFSSLIINVPDNIFSVFWFSPIIIVSYFIGGKKIGVIFSTLSILLVSLFIYMKYVNYNDISVLTLYFYMFAIISLSHYYSNVLEAKSKKLYKQNLELNDYKNNLEMMVEEKLKEIESLNKEIIDTQQEVIYTMGTIGESRSRETGNHVKRVAKYSYLLAKLYNLNEEESLRLQLASPMHDIGKVGIEDSILKKPAKLTKEEFEIMKEHSVLGYEMLKHSHRDIFKTAAIVAKQHHEKWDGSGYPNGLSGNDIHLYGRITAIADVFDALGSDRVYKKAWKDKDIFDLIKDQSGKHFDPDLVEIFFKNIDQFLEIRDGIKD